VVVVVVVVVFVVVVVVTAFTQREPEQALTAKALYSIVYGLRFSVGGFGQWSKIRVDVLRVTRPVGGEGGGEGWLLQRWLLHKRRAIATKCVYKVWARGGVEKLAHKPCSLQRLQMNKKKKKKKKKKRNNNNNNNTRVMHISE